MPRSGSALVPHWPLPHLRIFDPDVRAERRRRRARRSVGYRFVGTAGFGYLVALVDSGPGLEGDQLFWGTATVVAGAATVSAGVRLWRLQRAPRPIPTPKPRPVPPIASAAYAPVTRLSAREHALSELLTLLGAAAGDAWAEASAAAVALRRLADQLVALESARIGIPAEAGPGLDAALAALRLRLDEGVSAYDMVVAAATDAVAAAAEGRAEDQTAIRRLAEAADSLVGLARGLREVQDIPPRRR